jgi:hypothetical protein
VSSGGVIETDRLTWLRTAICLTIAITKAISIGIADEWARLSILLLTIHILILTAITKTIVITIPLMQIRLRTEDLRAIRDTITIGVWIIWISTKLTLAFVVQIIAIGINGNRQDDRTHDVARLSAVKKFRRWMQAHEELSVSSM